MQYLSWHKAFIVFSGLILPFVTPSISAQPPLMQPGAPGLAAKPLSVEESLSMGQAHFTQDDVAFMQAMIVHHAQAVEMVSLIEDRTNHEGITLIGNRITLSQTSEIEMMKTWLKRRGQKTDMADSAHAHHHGSNHGKTNQNIDPEDIPVMGGMLSPRQMKQLKASSQQDFERQFLEGMIEHHKGAIDMVEGLAATQRGGEDPEISEFMASIIADQTSEILRMKQMLYDLKEK